jgi:hypothetical protein
MKIRQNTSTAIALGFLSVFLPLALEGGMAQRTVAQFEPHISDRRVQEQILVQVTFEPPGEGEPTDTAGGASRDEDICAQQPLESSPCVTPLMPGTQSGLTVAERPEFYLYVPETEATELFFALKDENNRHHYQTKIPISGGGGILAVRLPEEVPALEIGQTYRWTFILVGKDGLRPDSPGVQGGIERVELNPNSMGELEVLTPLEKAALYGAEGIWYDTMSTLAQLRRSQPDDAIVEENWRELLASVGLEAIAERPLLSP